MQRFFGYTRILPTSEPAPGATITVYDAGTLNLATIFDDNLPTPTPKANPFTSDSGTNAGFFYFYAANGRYDVRTSSSDITAYTWGDVQLFDGESVDLSWKNVKAYGAVGDGVTNDLAAFQAAAAACCPGGTVYIPPLTNGKFYNLGSGWIIQNCRGINIVWGGSSAVIAATSPGADALNLWGCHYALLHGPVIQGVSGGGHGLVIGKADFTMPSFEVTVLNPLIPANLDGDGIRINHGLLSSIIRPRMSVNATRPSTDATLNGGAYGPGSTTTTGAGIRIPLQPSGQNNGISITDPVVDGFRGEGIFAEGVDGLIISGNTVEGSAQNASLLSRPANITLLNCDRAKVDCVYAEITATPVAWNYWLEDCNECSIETGTFGAAVSTHGGINLINCRGTRLVNMFGEHVSIDADCVDTVLDGVLPGGNGGDIVDFGTRTVRTRLREINSTNASISGQTLDSTVNMLRNPGFEQWASASSPVNWGVINCTATRCGTGESDTEKFRGRFCVRLDTRVDPTNGLRFIVDDYSDATTRAALVGRKITISGWIKVTAGIPPIMAAFYDNGAQTDTASATTLYNTSVGGWQKVGGTFVIRSGYSVLDVRFYLNSDASVFYLDEAFVGYGESQTTDLADRNTLTGAWGVTVIPYASTLTIDPTAANTTTCTLTGNVTTVNFVNLVPGKPFVVKFAQDGSGGHTVSGWAVSGGLVYWAGGVAPTINASALQQSTLLMVYDGTNVYELARTLGY